MALRSIYPLLTVSFGMIILGAPAHAQFPAANEAATSPGFLAALAHDLQSVIALTVRQLAQPVPSEARLIACLALAAVGIAVAWPLRLWLLNLGGRLLDRWDRERRCQAEAMSVIAIVGTTLLFGIGVHLLRLALGLGFPLLPQVAVLADAAAVGLGVTGFGIGVGRALVLSPFVDASGESTAPLGRRIAFYPIAGALLLGFWGVAERALHVIQAERPTVVLVHILGILLEAALTILFLIQVGQSRGGDRPAEGRRASFTLTAVGWTATALGLAGLLAGYRRLAALLFQELIWASMIAFTAMLLVQLVSALLSWLLGSKHAAGRFATQIMGLRLARIDQVRILAIGVAGVAIWVFAIGLMLAPLGGASSSLIDQIQLNIVGDELRKLHLAPRTIATAALILIVGITLTRMLRRWLQNRFLPATALDIGVRSSIVTGLSYAGILIALLAATNALGIALDKITLIASALSVGIGFGLQSIIQNFVSGVILLIERPIKVGDWVSASGAEGSVRRIRVRATEIAMPDGGVTIVPNSSFISANVQNRTQAGIAGRIDLTIKLSGGESPVKARDAILECISSIDSVQKQPPPKLLLTDASQDSYGFTLRVYAEENRPVAEAKSELLYAMADRLNATGMKAALS